MTASRKTRASTSAAAQENAGHEKPDRKASPIKKRKRFDLDQVTSDSDGKTRPPKAKLQTPSNSIEGSAGYSGPCPQHFRPTPEECQVARDGLAALHGDPKRAALGEEKFELAEGQAAADKQAPKKESWQKTVLDSLVCTILSQNTTDVNSARAFAKLKEKFPEWEMVRTADNGDVEESIKSGGLAAIKTERIKVILNTLKSERGECSLEHLQNSTDEEIKAELERFKGVGKKTIACVLMFCLDRHEFPVDTHVWRITKAMGWVPAKATRDEAYSHLNARIPDHLKYDLHVLLVNHGKRCPRCAKNGKPRKASDGDCPLFGTKTVKGILKEDLDADVDHEDASKQDPDVKADPDDKEALKKHKGRNAGMTDSEDCVNEHEKIDIKQEASEEQANIKQDPDVKADPDSSQL